MGKHRHSRATKAALAGTAIAAAVGMGLTPTMANAVSSNTYFIGFPEWLPIGDGNTLESNPNTIYEAILDSRDRNPLIGWGTGGVALNPQWVQWYNPNLGGLSLGDINLGDLSPTELANLLSHIDLGEATNPDNDQYYTPPATNPAWTLAFNNAKTGLLVTDKAAILAAPTIEYTLDLATIPGTGIKAEWWKYVPDNIRYQTISVDNPFLDNEAALDAVLAGGTYEATYHFSQRVKIKDPIFGFTLFDKTISADVPYKVDLAKVGLSGKNYDQLARDIVEASGIAETIPGGWTTNTFGQWVSPTNDITGLQNLDLSGLLNGDFDLSALAGLSTRDLAYYLSGDLGFLAPLLNWTAYIQNVNLIAYGDGAIATGEAYRKFLEAVKSGEIKAGEPLTDGRYLVIDTDENGNPVLNVVNHSQGDGSLTEIITSYPLPGDLVFPNMPVDANGNPIYPSYTETPGGVIDITFLTMALLRNPGRANGGLYARFAPIYQELTGVNPVSPDREDVLPKGVDPNLIRNLLTGNSTNFSVNDLGQLQTILEGADGKPIVITLKADLTWEYDLLSDAPVTANPIAWANSAASSLLLVNLAGSLLNIDTTNPGSLPIGLAHYIAPDGTFYGTLTTDQLPLLAPARLVAGLLSAATGEDVNTPVADALEPVLKLLVNTSYTDVERNEDGTWTRTLDQMHVPTLFGTQTLTRHQAALLAGDIIAELGRGTGSEYTDVVQRVTARVVTFLEDNDIQVPTEIKEAAAKLATEPGKAIQKVSREIGDGVSKVLTTVDEALPEGPAAPTQQQLASGQREVGKALGQVKTGADEVVAQVNSVAEQTGLDKAAGEVENAGKKIQADVTKRVTKTQKSLTHAQERAGKVADKLKQGDLKGAAKQVGDNVKNRVDRLKKDINNGADKLKGKDKNDNES
ncbi:PE-PPE domain-containing protein [Mycolicibacterium sp. 050232]|uniref:PE-PPE domain-containing protein n=1 Tax=Mycolicibacterium sp. 050232 TaxID=3113982 RepID=UPI002E2E8245|nr:PE-PPE domain-containing protein [Mycolicibacterium sp. 050232]MED5813825.1 PE-PPE domain-containing protein [Mycolicibacterium sp. 050232]